MSTQSLDPEAIRLISGLVAEFIEEQRDSYKSIATPLSAEQRSTLGGFFCDSLLDVAKTHVLTNKRLSNPGFFSMARSMGISDLPDFSAVEAVTFENVVVSHEPFTDGLLFHEMVRV